MKIMHFAIFLVSAWLVESINILDLCKKSGRFWYYLYWPEPEKVYKTLESKDFTRPDFA